MISRNLRVMTILAMMSAGIYLLAEDWAVRPDGVGPVKIGMSLPQLNAVLGEKLARDPKDEPGCFYVNPQKHPHLLFMIEDGRVARVDVIDASVSTAEGVRVGDSEARALQVYGQKLKVTPHAYTAEEGGHYLTIRSRDGGYGIRFETEKGKIAEFHAGGFKAIQYIEGCE